MAYRLDYTPAARKAIRAIRDVKLKRRIETALLALCEEPRPSGAKRLVGLGGTLRIRVGDWRILYEVREQEVVVLVVRIGPRGEVYERVEWWWVRAPTLRSLINRVQTLTRYDPVEKAISRNFDLPPEIL